jgi:hypothetical protein
MLMGGMDNCTRRSLLASFSALPVLRLAAQDDGWVPLFDGKSLNGWTASENKASWKVVDGALVGDGPRSHLFYTGPVRGGRFRNFEAKAEVLAKPLCNSGFYFQTAFQEKGFPSQGFEVQVNNTALGEDGYLERKKTGSLYGVRNVYKALASDDKWFQLHVVVRGKRVQVSVNGTLVVEYIEPTPPLPDPDGPGRILTTGTFALQCHDPGSKVFFRNILVKPLPDDLPTEGNPPVVDAIYKEIRLLSARNYPVVDYHAHLKGGWTLEQALANSRANGIFYGIAVNCGVGFPIQNDAPAAEFVTSMRNQPAFAAMQAEGREWVKMFSPQTVASFDYVFSDAMTFHYGDKRVRLWIPSEVPAISNPEEFMDVIVDRIVGVVSKEPIDIYANPTFLPDILMPNYDKLWTDKRIARVVEAAARTGVAIEINNRYKLPSKKIIVAAKAAGTKFSFGTNNGDPNIGQLEYPLQMVEECGLKWQDLFFPKPDGSKPVQLRGLPS